MIVDENLEFSDAQTLVAAAAEITSEDTVDLQVADPQYGAGTPLWLIVQVHTAVTCTATADLQVDFKHSDDGSTWVDIVAARSFSTTLDPLTKGGYLIVQPLPAALRRYLELTYTPSATLDTGAVSAYISNCAPNTTIYGKLS